MVLRWHIFLYVLISLFVYSWATKIKRFNNSSTNLKVGKIKRFNNSSTSLKIGKISKRAQNGDTLINFLANNDKVTIEVDNDELPFSFEGITIYDLADNQETFKFRLATDITLVEFMKINKGEEIFARFVNHGRLKGYSLNRWDPMEIRFDETQSWLGLALFLSPNGQDMFVELSFRWNTYPFDDYLQLLGFENREDILNMDGLDTRYITDDLRYLDGRISRDGLWHFFMASDNFQYSDGLLCSKFGTGDAVTTACAFFIILDKESLKRIMADYAPTLALSNLKARDEELIFMSAKKSFKFSDSDSAMKDRIAARKKETGESVFSEIPGGNNFFFIKLPIRLMNFNDEHYEITSDTYDVMYFDCKLYRDKFEMVLFPQVPVTIATVKSLLPDGALKDFFTNDFVSTTLIFEKYEVLPNDKVCATIRHATGHVIIQDKYVIKDTVMKFCQEGGVLNFESDFNQETNFNSKMLVNIEKDPAGGQMKISGSVKILDGERLTEVIDESFMSSIYEEVFGHLKQFPIVTLGHAHKLGTNYMTFNGVALFQEIEFNLQAVYIFSGGMESTSPLSLCLEKKQMIKNANDEDVAAPTLNFIDFMEYLLNEKNLGIGSVTKFKRFSLSFQQNAQFYSSLSSDDSLKCRSLASQVIAREEFGSDIPQIFMSARQTDYRCNVGTEMEKSICNFIKGALGYSSNDYGTNEFYGFLKPNHLKLASKFPLAKTFNIASGLSLEGIDSDRPLYQIIEWKRAGLTTPTEDEESRGNKFKGYLTKNNIRDQFRLQGEIQITEDKVLFSVPDTPDPRPETGFLGIAYVNEYIFRSIRHPIPTEGDIYLKFHSDLKIGSVSDRAIEIPGVEDMTGQYLYGNPSNNKLFACFEQATEKSLTEIFAAFGLSLSNDMFTSLMLTHVCFTYTTSESWEIESRGIKATSGLWLHGKTKINALDVYKRPRDFLVDVRMKCSGDNKKILIEQPPLFFYPIAEAQTAPSDEEGSAIQESNFKVQIINSKTSKDTGPMLEISLNGNAISKVELKGFVSTLAFESDAVFSVDSTNFQDLVFIPPQKKSHKKSESEPLLGTGFELKGVWRKENSFQASTFQFKFNGNRLVPHAQSGYSTLVSGKKSFYQAKKDGHNDLKQNIETKLQDPGKKASKRGELSSMLKEIQMMKRTLNRHEKKKFMPCSKSCKAMLSPGFTWDNCHVSDRIGNVSCLNFKTNALRSCDMPCLAKCEVGRVDADELSKKMFKEINGKIRTLSKRTVQSAIYNDLLAAVEQPKAALLTSMSLFNTDFETLNGIGDQFPLASISTEWVNFADFSKSTKLDFKLTYEDGEEESYEAVVDGSLPMRIAESYLEKLHSNKLTAVEGKEEDVQKKYAEVMQIILDWEIENRDQILKEKRKRPGVKKAKSKKKKNSKTKSGKGQEKGKRRSYDDVTIRQTPSSLYHEEKLSSKYLIRTLAPWNTLRSHDPFTNIQNSPVNAAKRIKISKSASVCTNRRNRIRDFHDIMSYMSAWSNAYDAARKHLDESQRDIANGMKILTADTHKRSLNNTSSKRKTIQENWMNRLQTGFNTWENEFNRQLTNFYTMGPKLMYREINAIFTPNGYDSFDNYVKATGGQLSQARSIDADQSVYQLGQYLLNGLSSMQSLGENRNFISKMKDVISQIEKQGCHDEL